MILIALIATLLDHLIEVSRSMSGRPAFVIRRRRKLNRR
jgi:hypothetical protein